MLTYGAARLLHKYKYDMWNVSLDMLVFTNENCINSRFEDDMALAAKKIRSRVEEDLDGAIERTCNSILQGASTVTDLQVLHELEAYELESRVRRLDFLEKDEIISTVVEASDIIFKLAKKI